MEAILKVLAILILLVVGSCQVARAEVEIDLKNLVLFSPISGSYRIGAGILDSKGVSVTPTGQFKITVKTEYPWYIRFGKVLARPFNVDPINNVYGSRLIQLNYIRNGRHLCIHGTNEPEKIGTYCSHCCIRLKNKDIEKLFQVVKPGDVVIIK